MLNSIKYFAPPLPSHYYVSFKMGTMPGKTLYCFHWERSKAISYSGSLCINKKLTKYTVTFVVVNVM